MAAKKAAIDLGEEDTSAEERDLENFQEKLKEEEEPTQTVANDDGTEDEVISLQDDEDEEEERSTRKQRRSNRYAELQRQLEEERERSQQFQQQLLQTVQQGLASREARPDPNDPAKQFEAEWNDIMEKQRLYAQEIAAKRASKTLTPEEYSDYVRKASELEREKAILGAKMANPAPQQQGPQEDPGVAAIRARMEMDYPEVVADKRAMAWASGRYSQLVAEGLNNREAFERAMEGASVQFGKGGRPARRPPPTRGQRKKSEGVSSGAAEGAGAQEIRMTKEFKIFADHAFPHLPPEKRYKHWAKTTGKRTFGKDT